MRLASSSSPRWRLRAARISPCASRTATTSSSPRRCGPTALRRARSPTGVVAHGDIARAKAAADPPEVTPTLLRRGQERYEIFCTPCHGLAGRGDGMIVARGFPAPPSYHTARLRAAPARHFFDVITNGYGVMYSYAARVPPEDRWAIVAYIRALQLSQGAKVASVPEAKDELP